MPTEYEFSKTAKTYSVVKHVKYEENFHFELDENGFLVEPKCSGCGVGVLRPRCFYEQGSDCPRHDTSEIYQRIIRRDPTTHKFREKMDVNWSTGQKVETPTGICYHCSQEKNLHENQAD